MTARHHHHHHHHRIAQVVSMASGWSGASAQDHAVLVYNHVSAGRSINTIRMDKRVTTLPIFRRATLRHATVIRLNASMVNGETGKSALSLAAKAIKPEIVTLRSNHKV